MKIDPYTYFDWTLVPFIYNLIHLKFKRSFET